MVVVVKVIVVWFGEEVIFECMYIFGGVGYFVDEMMFGKWWWDMKFVWVGGGIDEVLWELVVVGMMFDYDGYVVVVGVFKVQSVMCWFVVLCLLRNLYLVYLYN